MATDKQVLDNILTRIGYKILNKEHLDTYESLIFLLTAFSYFSAFCKWPGKWKKIN